MIDDMDLDYEFADVEYPLDLLKITDQDDFSIEDYVFRIGDPDPSG